MRRSDPDTSAALVEDRLVAGLRHSRKTVAGALRWCEDPLVLGLLGINAAEEELYTLLLDNAPATAADLARAAAERPWSVDTERLLHRLEELGLVTPLVSDQARYHAVDPDVALDAALLAAGQALSRARRRAAQLATVFRAATPRVEPRPLVEVVVGRPAIAQALEDLERSVRHEIRVCDAPPYSTGEHQPSAMEPELLGRGVRCRVLYDRVGLETPGRLADVEIGIAAGEQARVTDVPTKLVLSDHPRALLPLQHDPDHVETSLIVHDPALCDALWALFEMYWERAIPLEVRDGSAHLPDVDDAPSPEERALLPLLTAGLTDRAMAAELGCSERTVRRRLRAMFDRLDATTRTQAGYQAVARGWLAVPERGMQ